MTTITTTQAAVLLNKSEPTIRRWCNQGRIPARRFGKAWMIESDDLPADALKKFLVGFCDDMAAHITTRAQDRNMHTMAVEHVSNAIRKYGREWRP